MFHATELGSGDGMGEAIFPNFVSAGKLLALEARAAYLGCVVFEVTLVRQESQE